MGSTFESPSEPSGSAPPALVGDKRKPSRSPSPDAAMAPEPAGSTSAAATENGDTGVGSSNAAQDDAKKVAKKRRGDNKFVSRLRKEAAKQISKFGEDPVYYEIQELIGKEKVAAILKSGREFEKKFDIGEVLEVEIRMLGAHGQGLAIAPGQDWVIAVPKALPGDRVRVQVRSNERLFAKARIVDWIARSEELRDVEPFCRYFSLCGGCQYQMMSYERQLKIKQRVVENAFKNYSQIDSSLLPEIRPTMPSPKQRAYRTKLTPHFNLPREVRAYKRGAHVAPGKGKTQNGVTEEDDGAPLPVKPDVTVPIGFDGLDGHVLDIEECPIGTEAINAALPAERKRIKDTIFDFQNGATMLLRDSLESFEAADGKCVAVTNHKATVKEVVGTTKFESPAGAFFQNNRSILPDLIGYVKDEILASRGSSDAKDGQYLVDAYCGSGLFSLCLAHLFEKVAGVEISSESIKCAKKNADLNGIDNAVFLAGNAENIFATIDFAPEKTTVIIDPPRRGCDEPFIEQLVKLAPRTIVYVSCNVHTQARDVGSILKRDPSYKILSIRGADLFPQTNHVEGICVLKRESA